MVIETDIGKICVGCFYRSSSLNNDQNNKFIEYFAEKSSCNNEVEKVLFGDFNCPDISWISGNVNGPVNSANKSTQLQQSFLDAVHDAGLSWLVTGEVTRRRKVGENLQESTIDQVFCSDESLISDFEINPPLGKSDHVTIIVDLNTYKPNIVHNTEVDDVRRNWSKVGLSDILELSSNVNFQYSRDTSLMNVEEM